MSTDPFAFNYETARDLVKLLKRTRNGEFSAQIEADIPQDQSSKFVWAYVPASTTGTFNATVKAWELLGATLMFPMNIGLESTGKVQWGKTDEYGVINGGITATIFVPNQTGTATAPIVGSGFYLGKVFRYDDAENPMVLIAKPPASGSGGAGGNAVIDVVTDVQCGPEGLTLSTVTFSGADYDNAVIRNFLALSDVTAKSYTANQGRAVVVNAEQTGLEFGAIVGEAADSFIALTDTPEAYGSSNTYKVLTVSSTNAGVSFSDNNITTKNSIKGGGNPNGTSYQEIELINDEDAPAAFSFYGANSASVKGFYTISFKNLSDTPDSYTSSGGKFLKVNDGATAIEFSEIDLTSIEDDLANLTTDLGNTQTDITSIQSDLADALTTLSSQAGDLSSIQNDLGSVTEAIQQIQTDVAALLSDMQQTVADVNSLISSITTAESNIASITYDIGSINGQISSLDSRISALENA
jgi:prefoldin subunit 5